MEPRILHTLPGRLRLHWPIGSGPEADRIANRLRRIEGVRSVRANPLTGNLLIHYDPHTTDPATIVAAAHAADGRPMACGAGRRKLHAAHRMPAAPVRWGPLTAGLLSDRGPRIDAWAGRLRRIRNRHNRYPRQRFLELLVRTAGILVQTWGSRPLSLAATALEILRLVAEIVAWWLGRSPSGVRLAGAA